MPKELRQPDAAKLVSSELAEVRAQAAAWRADHCWHPRQLRHNAATRLRKEFGIEAARLILGHASMDATAIYAERDHERARKLNAEIG